MKKDNSKQKEKAFIKLLEQLNKCLSPNISIRTWSSTIIGVFGEKVNIFL